MNIKVQQLQHFTLVAKYKGFRRASASALRTQAALSNSIKSLEDILGAPLFETSHNATLTPFGEACLPKVQEFLDHFETLQRFMNSAVKGSIGQLNLGCIPSAAQSLLPKILPKFTESYPDVKISLIDNTSADLYECLMNGNITMALTSYLDNMDQNVIFIPILKDPLCVVCHKDHPLAQKKKVSLKDLSKHRFISNGITLAVDWKEMKQINLNATQHIENVLSINTVLEINMGVTILGKLLMPEDPKNLCWLPIDMPSHRTHRQIGFLYKKSNENNNLVKNFIRLTQENVLPLYC